MRYLDVKDTHPPTLHELPRTRAPSWWWGLVGLMVGLLVLALAGCGLPADSVRELERLRDGAQALADDPAASPRERETGLVVADALWQALFAVGDVDELPAGVRERREARRPKDAPR